jgi:hypothetical protein
MKLSGFTYIRNGSALHYPFIESIKSLLPIVDEFIVLVCDSTDNTKELVENINDSKIRIYDSDWDQTAKLKGEIHSNKTNESLKYITGDFGFYLQGDELVHEKDYDDILKVIEENKNNESVKGLVFNYMHFFGGFFSYPKKEYMEKIFYYDKETRIIRNDKTVISSGDATGFAEINGKAVSIENGNAVKMPENVKIYHYGKALKPEYNYKKEHNTLNINESNLIGKLKIWTFNFSPKIDKYIYGNLNFLEFVDRKNLQFHPEPIRNLANKQNWEVKDFINYRKKPNAIMRFFKITVYRIINEIYNGIKKIRKNKLR